MGCRVDVFVFITFKFCPVKTPVLFRRRRRETTFQPLLLSIRFIIKRKWDGSKRKNSFLTFVTRRQNEKVDSSRRQQQSNKKKQNEKINVKMEGRRRREVLTTVVKLRVAVLTSTNFVATSSNSPGNKSTAPSF